MADILPPHTIEAEEAVLGSLLIDPEAALRVAPYLKPEMFYIVKNGWIYDAILKLQERREAIDLLTVSAELDRDSKLSEIGGEGYIAQLTNSVPTALNVETYAHLVEAMFTRRKMIQAASEVARIAYDQTIPVDQMVEKSEAAVFSVSEGKSDGAMVPMRRAVNDFYERIEYLHEHKDEPLGIPTGYPDLDKLTGGMNKGDLVIIAARPGIGKTSLMLNLAYNAAYKHRQRVAVFSLEMGIEQLVHRFVSSETGIDSQRLRVGDLRDDEWGSLNKIATQMSDLLIFMDDTPSLTPLDLRVKSRRIYQEYGLDLIVVDYLQLMTSENAARGGGENRVQEISYISRNLKQIARELKVPLIAGSQLSRLVEQRSDKRPMLSDLRESGCLSGDTLVTMADTGERVTMRELANTTGFKVWALNEATMQLEKSVVTNAFSTGHKPVFLLTTRLGREIKATGNHRFRIMDGWKRLDELAVGERVALPRHIALPQKQTMSDLQLKLLGHLLGDGCTLPNHSIQYTTADEDIAKLVATIAIELFGSEVNPRIQKEHDWYQVYLTSTRRHTHKVRSVIAEWLTDLGVWGLRSYEKFVPKQVFLQPPNAVALFLRHLWATDGCIHLSKTGVSHYPSIYYASSSKTLAKDVQSLLLRLGINARLSVVSQKGKGRDQFRVDVSGKADLDKFIKVIEAVGERKCSSLLKVSEFLSDKLGNTNRDIIPNVVWRQLVVPAMQSLGLTSRQMQASLGTQYCGTTLYKNNLSRERAGRVAEIVQSNDLEILSKSDVYWDEILSIEPCGTEEVFDLTVPKHHNFVANDVVVHNSIEQDADIVSFIYRDEVYNPDTDQKNIAEISVQKNRNGPTGKINLFFDKRLTSFKNLAREKIEL